MITKYWFQNYPQSYIAYIELEENPNRFLGRVLKNEEGEQFTVEVLQDCICVNVGSRGQTLFNYTVSIAGMVKSYYKFDPTYDENCVISTSFL